MSANHKRALEILSNPNIDYQMLVYRIGVVCPSAIVNAVDGSKADVKRRQKDKAKIQKDTEIMCLRLCKEGRKIDAIKEYRSAFNIGLGEAKDAVEALMVGQIL